LRRIATIKVMLRPLVLFVCLIISAAAGFIYFDQNQQHRSAVEANYQQPFIAKEASYTVNGDSLTVPTKKYLKDYLPNWRRLSFSARGGRQYRKALNILQGQPLGRVVVFALGTNDWALRGGDDYGDMIDGLIAYLGPDRCLVMATIYDHGSVDDFNRVLYQRAAYYGPRRIVVVPWAEAVDSGQVRTVDGIHLWSRSGNRLRARMIAAGVERCG